MDQGHESGSKEETQIERNLVRKLDWKLIPWLSFLYLISYLDRTNIGNAKIVGLQTDLNMTDAQYNLALTVFFISYSIAEPFCNILIKRLRPSIFLTGIMIVWGVCMISMGLVQNARGLIVVRFFLGLAEAGLFPGINYYLSCWYRRAEFGIRAAIFFSAAAIAGSFGGLLAVAIAEMDGIGGKPGWAWIFILEGLATVLVGIASYWMVYDFPDKAATFLSDADRTRIRRRLQADKQSSAEHEEFQMRFFWASVKDWKTYAYAVVYMGCVSPLYAFSLFLPTILKEMGHSSTRATLLSVPPYALAAIVTIFVGWSADHTRKRGYANIIVSLFGLVGFSMLISSGDPTVQYVGTFLAATGIYPCIPNTITWAANNLEGVYKRGISLGFIIGWGNLNGIVSSNIYQGKNAPRYFVGHSVVLAYLCLFLLGGSVVTRVLLGRENCKRSSGERDSWVKDKDANEIRSCGDMRPDFLYTT